MTDENQEISNQEILSQNLSDPVDPADSENIGSPNQAPMIINQKYDKVFERDAIFHIEVDKIKPNPYQPRKDFDEELLKELAASIREFGIIQPLVVSKIEKEVETGTEVEYQLIAGERRLMASKIAGLERVPVIIRRIDQRADQMEIAIVENLQRANLSPIETARAYARLSDEFGLTQREIAVRIGKSRETIANTLRLLNLPTEIQEAIGKNQISESQGRLLLTIDDPAQQMAFFRDLLNNNLTVRELRRRIHGIHGIHQTNQQSTTDNQQEKIADPEIINFQEQLTDLLGAPVKIVLRQAQDKKEGEVVISFYSPEEIKGIIDKLNPQSQTSL
ncbi:MAG: ParB/RepB/Spo0J family partition protein [Patescibacteria group bacterium]